MNIPASIKRIETCTSSHMWYSPQMGMNIPASIKRIETHRPRWLRPGGCMRVWISPPLLRGLKLYLTIGINMSGNVWISPPLLRGLKHRFPLKQFLRWQVWISPPLLRGLKPMSHQIKLQPKNSMNIPASIKRIETWFGVTKACVHFFVWISPPLLRGLKLCLRRQWSELHHWYEYPRLY